MVHAERVARLAAAAANTLPSVGLEFELFPIAPANDVVSSLTKSAHGLVPAGAETDDPDMVDVMAKKRAATKAKIWAAIREIGLRENRKLAVADSMLVFRNMWNQFCAWMSVIYPSTIWSKLLWVNDNLKAAFQSIYKNPLVAKEKAAELQSGL